MWAAGTGSSWRASKELILPVQCSTNSSSARRVRSGEIKKFPRGQFSWGETMTDDSTNNSVENMKAEEAVAKAKRPWFKKKRFIIPTAIFVVIVFASAASAGEDSTPNSSISPSSSTELSSSDKDKAAEEQAAEEQAAADKAAEEQAAEEQAAEEQAAADKAAAEPVVTTGQRNALQEAKSYLDYTAFSRQGLIDQLIYEGYSSEDSTYGADSVGADWNVQAALSAKSYLEYTSFSRQGLIDQLVYEGFSQAEAEYGVSQNGY
jgi:flagellar biosynthesis GTPase FlhF